jgi:multisubunit Na+/H+ antiporter MnhC subunit
MLKKVLGFSFLLGGIGLIIFFPFIREYQPEEMSKSITLIGIILIGIGIYLLIS